MFGKCSLAGKCNMYDPESLPCIDYAGRIERGGGRAPCYGLMKQQIREQKIENLKSSYLGRGISRVIRSFLRLGGVEEEDLN